MLLVIEAILQIWLAHCYIETFRIFLILRASLFNSIQIGWLPEQSNITKTSVFHLTEWRWLTFIFLIKRNTDIS